MIWSPWIDGRVRLAAAAATLTVALAFNEARLALRHEFVMPAASAVAPVRAGTVTTRWHEPLSLSELFGVASARRATPAMIAPPPALAALRLIGTVAGTDSPSAICVVGSEAPRLLQLGDTIGGWRLQHVAPAMAVFIDAAGRRHELRLSSSGN